MDKPLGRILCVDDEINVLRSLQRVFEDTPYEVDLAGSGREGLRIMEEAPVCLVLADYRMPEMNGIEFLREVYRLWPSTTRMILSGYADAPVLLSAINEGHVYRFLTKPWDNDELRFTVANAMERYVLTGDEDRAGDGGHQPDQTLDRLKKATGGIVQAMVYILERRDPYTAAHQRKVSALARSIASEMGVLQEVVDGIAMAGAIHDIGKIAIPAEILCKPGKLSSDESKLIRMHPEASFDILKNIDFPVPVARMALQHHERMDGSGYPHALKGDGILPEARILAIADVVEAITSHRPYRPALGMDRAIEELTLNKGTLYDEEAADACLKLIARREQVS